MALPHLCSVTQQCIGIISEPIHHQLLWLQHFELSQSSLIGKGLVFSLRMKIAFEEYVQRNITETTSKFPKNLSFGY